MTHPCIIPPLFFFFSFLLVAPSRRADARTLLFPPRRSIIAPHITVTCVHPGAVITEIVGVNMDMPDADERFIEDMPPWVRAELLAVPEGEARQPRHHS